ncbi:helix-turn-helix domain-containing protein [Photobacterium leiognathi subsp. mandapamensis]|uniref:helix-turn-helix domain-containing protein n=1 Tax=Photobacterium leiognathi TaxID=553611 RepID=UPI003AF40628
MIKCNLSAIMGAKRLKIADVVRDAGINRNTVTRLYHETNNRIDFDTLEKLCRYLNCEVGDLLEITDDEDGRTPL